MMLGTPGKLLSQFRLTYNMILNLLRVEALRVEEMIKRSFSENASQRLLPDQQKRVAEVSIQMAGAGFDDLLPLQGEKKLSALQKLECDVCIPDISAFYDDSFEIMALNERLLTMAAESRGVKSLLGGRVVILRDGVHLLFDHSAILNLCQSISGRILRQYC